MNPLPLAPNYTDWNARLHDFALREARESADGGDADPRFYLSVRPFLDATGNNGQFEASVAATYANLLRAGHDPISCLSNQYDAQKRPLSVAFLGLSVLAAELTQNIAYYPHLATLLNQPLQGSSVRGFATSSFEAAWLSLEKYLRGRGFYMEAPERTAHRFVRWPRKHALLRQVDVLKLPQFFRESGISPRRSIAESDVKKRLDRWCKFFTGPGQKAWSNPDRQSAILRQVLRALETWDGTLPPQAISASGGSLAASSALQIRRAQASLVTRIEGSVVSLLIRSPRSEGFPFSLALGANPASVTLRSHADDAFYRDVPLPPAWAHRLEDGIEGRSGRYAVTLRGAGFYPLQWSELEDYEAAPFLRVGVRGAILCQRRLLDRVQEFVRRVCQTNPICCTLDVIFPGWVLLHNIRPVKPGFTLIESVILEARDTCLLRPVGGLRLGRERAWIEGAPPRWVDCTGRFPMSLQINNTECAVVPHGAGGRAEIAACLQEPGEYVIWAGRERYRLQIISPRLDQSYYGDQADAFWTQEAPLPPAVLPSPTPTGPASGTSDMIAASLPLVETISNAVYLGPRPWERSASVAQAAWALTRTGGLSVVALSSLPPDVQMPPAARLARPDECRQIKWWAETVLAFASARIGVVSSSPNSDLHDDSCLDHDLIRGWRTYVEVATHLRRRLHAVSAQQGAR